MLRTSHGELCFRAHGFQGFCVNIRGPLQISKDSQPTWTFLDTWSVIQVPVHTNDQLRLIAEMKFRAGGRTSTSRVTIPASRASGLQTDAVDLKPREYQLG